MAALLACLVLGIASYHSRASFLAPKPLVGESNGTAVLTHNDTNLHEVFPHSAVANASNQLGAPLPGLLNQSMPLLHVRNSNAQASNITWGAGTVYFLFLVNNALPHSDIWRSFFANAPQGSWKALVHCKDPNGCSMNGVFTDNPGFTQVPTTPTWYCHDLVTAMVSLLAGAINSGVSGGREKFVFVSDSTLPVKPFNEVHSTLLLDDNSDFCLFPSDQWASASIGGQFVKLLKHHQWVVLNRQHADFFTKNWVPVDAHSRWRIWLKSGTWEGRERFVDPTSFYYPPSANTCTDEWAWMATIFGALEPMSGARYLTGFGGGQIDMRSHTTQGRCRTWSYWDNTWDPASAALASQIANDFYGSQMSCYPKCFARPASLERVSHSSLHALRQSPFLFARKFSPTAWMPNYYDIVLSY